MHVRQTFNRDGGTAALLIPVLLTVGLAVSVVTGCGDRETVQTYTVEEIRTLLETSGIVIDSSSPVQEVPQMTADEGYRWAIDGEYIEIYRYSPVRPAARRALARARKQGLKQQSTLIVGNVAVVIGGHPDSVALRRALQQSSGPN